MKMCNISIGLNEKLYKVLKTPFWLINAKNVQGCHFFGSPAKVCGLCIDSCKSKQEEFSINDAPKLCSELLDLCIEGFCSSIG